MANFSRDQIDAFEHFTDSLAEYVERANIEATDSGVNITKRQCLPFTCI